MSMEIKRDEKLTPSARQYLADRNQHELIAQIDDAYPPDKEQTLVNPNAGWSPATGLENLSDEELLAELRRRNPDATDVPDDDEPPYEEWTKDELDEELSKRQDANGKPLSLAGSNAAKAARLRAHDAAAPKPL